MNAEFHIAIVSIHCIGGYSWRPLTHYFLLTISDGRNDCLSKWKI